MTFFNFFNNNNKKYETFYIDNNSNNSSNPTNILLIFFWLIFLLIWVVAGILMSIICIFYKGSVSDKFLGYIIATTMGPFYWLFYIFNNDYCLKWNSPPKYDYQQPQQQTTIDNSSQF